SAGRRPGQPGCTSRCASTVSPSIPYNGLRGSDPVHLAPGTRRGHMSSRTRLIVLSISAPVIVFAIVGGFLGKVMAGEETFQNRRIFDDATQLITNNYVESVNVDKVMNGAMRGLAEALDPDSAYLSPSEAKQAESATPLPAGDTGLELTRQY